ncbi:MAG: hypothetical protein KF849_11195 [Rhizobiaceae bacterium]|nr:hypothetical protein [Rhizobiaceae bacterium]
MTLSTRAGRGPVFVFLAALASLAGCMSVDEPKAPAGGAQPRLATYSCGEDGTLRIEAASGMVRVTLTEPADPKAAPEDARPPEPVELPAAPPGQSTRFGKEGYALVVEGREALYMKAGRVPMTCTR